MMNHVLNLYRKPRVAENGVVDTSEDPIAMSLLWPTSQLTAGWVSSPTAIRKDSQVLSPYDDDVGDDDRGAGVCDAASPPYDRGPAAIAKWYACFRLVSR